ncbi:MAG: hypothetical protein PW735_03790 [Acidobacteriaceae bacterium]|nr:hypothetical protein [Acidobacteriaceae bacterium]
MKIFFSILGYVIAAAALFTLVRFFWEQRRQKKIDATGTVVFATLVSMQPVKMFGRIQGDLYKITLRVQEPGASAAHEVTMRSRLDPRAQMQPGSRVPVVLDPKNPKRIYPASQESSKRAVMTGPRGERRLMEAQMRNPQRGIPTPPKGYMPPNMNNGGSKRRYQ